MHADTWPKCFQKPSFLFNARILPALLILTFLFTAPPALALTEIHNATELQAINDLHDYDYVLANDIDASETATWNHGAGFVPIGNDSSPFVSTFDGAGYVITGLHINRPDMDGVGLFGVVGWSDSINAVQLSEVNIVGRYGVGGLTGVNECWNITNCSVTGSISGDIEVGGLVGSNKGGIANCYSRATVSGSWGTGGLVGWNYRYCTISTSYSDSQVSGEDDTGGLIGENEQDTSVSNCFSIGYVLGFDNTGGLIGYNSGSVSECHSRATVSGHDGVGGLLGSNGGSLLKCFSFGNISGRDRVGGLAGSSGDTISACYSMGNVSGENYAGGLIGTNSDSISNCYSTARASGRDRISGFIAYTEEEGATSDCFWDTETSHQTASMGGTPKTTLEMIQQATFTNWDFSTPVWGILENHTYPYLQSLSVGTGLEQAIGQTDPTDTLPILFDLVFSEPVSGFDNTTVDFSESAAAVTAYAVMDLGDGSSFRIEVTAIDGDGTVVARIPGGICTAISNGAPNNASASVDNTVTYTLIPAEGEGEEGETEGVIEGIIEGEEEGSQEEGETECPAPLQLTDWENGIRDPWDFTYFPSQDRIYFARFIDYETYAIWVTDGTPEGTGEVSLPSTIVSAYPIAAGTSLLYFVATDDAGVTGLWRTDETPEGTINLGTCNGSFESHEWTSYHHLAATVGNRLFFRVVAPAPYNQYVGELWRSDGTPETTIKLVTFDLEISGGDSYPGFLLIPSGLTAFNGKLIFAGASRAYGIEPWVSDGTTEGTRTLKDITPVFPDFIGNPENEFSSMPRRFKIYDDLLYFHAYPCLYEMGTSYIYYTGSRELWQTDGTSDGTVPVALAPDAWKIVTLDSLSVYTNAEGLWSVPNTGGEPTQLIPWNEAPIGLTGTYGLTRVNTKVVFWGETYEDFEPWVTDGTLEGTTLLKNINPHGYSVIIWKSYDPYEPDAFLAEGEYLFFCANDGIHNAEIWCTDGTSNGTRRVTDISPGTEETQYSGVYLGIGSTLFQHRLFFLIEDESGDLQLWSLDLSHFDPACTFDEEGEPEGIAEGAAEGEGEGGIEGVIEEGEGGTEGQTSEGEGQTEGTSEGETGAHTADQDGDGRIGLSELLRVIQFFNSDGYHCDAAGEDGFAPGPGDTSCTAHDSDYNAQDWHINLSELLRIIQFYNSPGYAPCTGSEDGFCPVS
ncbi:MAG TPA: hypothetical protein PLI09_04540 [Candidatus Hydrogenedentes bacterium]|nr:hypothetical protein [Candidatus Hydrogenedentota bacterium]